jgi:uncharacterized protein with FMN-binding domain
MNRTRSRIAALALGIGSLAFGLRAWAVTVMRDGKYTGKRVYAYYGYVRVQAVVKSGKLADVTVVEFPNDNPRSRRINETAVPYLVQETVDAQSYKVDLVSGATFTSRAYMSSLQDALKAAGL